MDGWCYQKLSTMRLSVVVALADSQTLAVPSPWLYKVAAVACVVPESLMMQKQRSSVHQTPAVPSPGFSKVAAA
jgi:hypothetical protein